MKPITVSIIIPVYQVENYLSDCIESVLSQSYRYVEIILVDDGSTDYSPIICDSYATRYSNIRVIHQKNAGQSAARNAGMAIASGEYLMFLDSDDLLAESDVLQHMAERVTNSDTDILTGNYCTYQNGQLKTHIQHHLKGGAYVQTPEFRFYGFYHSNHLSYPWGKLYRKEFLQKERITFQNFSFAEDILFNLECYFKNPVYDFTDHVVVIYRQHSGSQTTSYFPNFNTLLLRLCDEYTKLVCTCHSPKEYLDIVALHCIYGSFFLVNQELIHYKRNHAFRHTVDILKKYADSPSVVQMLYELSKGNYLQGIPSRTFRLALQGLSFLLYRKKYFLFTLCASAYYKFYK